MPVDLPALPSETPQWSKAYLESTSRSSHATPQKGKGTGRGHEKDAALVGALAAARESKSLTHDTFIAKGTNLAKLLEAAGVYHQRVTATRRGHGLCPPCIHIAAALLKYPSDHANPEVRGPVALRSTQFAQTSLQRSALRIRQCRLTKCHDESSYRSPSWSPSGGSLSPSPC